MFLQRTLGARLSSLPSAAWWQWSWLLIFLVGLFARGPYPPDETRYLAVGWEMWRDAELLVPQLNDQPYPDKPPLLFWLWQAGWALFGVSDAWPRFLAAAFMGGAAYCVHAIAKRTWPEDGDTVRLVPLVFAGTVYVALYTQMLMFDSMMTFLVVLGWRALLAESHPGWKAGLVAGAGMLTKGPIMLVYLVPLALFLPQLKGRRPQVLVTLLLTGFAMPATWLAVLALRGHAEFIETLLLEQTVSRIEGTIGHGRPSWWYLPILPLVLLPWSILPGAWRGAWREAGSDSRTRAALLAGLAMLVALSAIGGKQVHYLLPLIAVLSLPVGRVLANALHAPRLFHVRLFAALGVLVSLAPAVLVESGVLEFNAADGLLPWWPAVLPAVFLFTMALDAGEPGNRTAMLASCSLLNAIAILLVALPATNPTHDLRQAAAILSTAERNGYELAHVGNYQGEFQFLARLEGRVTELAEDEVRAWQSLHPRSLVITRGKRAHLVSGRRVHGQHYRGGELEILVTGADAARSPERDFPFRR